MRILRFSKSSNAFLGEIQESQLISAKLREEINGEHSLALVTTQELSKGERLLFRFGTTSLKTYEYVVAGVDEEHVIGSTVMRTYYCVWSLQEDLQSVMVSVMPGVGTGSWASSGVTADAALKALLSTQTRWGIYDVDTLRYDRASMYDRTAWDALATFLETWGGEVREIISTNSNGSVKSREIAVYRHIGSTTPVYRFDFGRDTTSVKRSFPDAPLYCRITPRGKGEATENGGYGRKVTIASVNSGKNYLENTAVKYAYRIKNPDGTYIYPTLKVENPDCETPTQLLEWARGVLEYYTTPQIVYTVDVKRVVDVNTAYTLMDRLRLGDVVQVSDDFFGSTPLKLESRIVAIEYNLLDERDVVYTIGSSKESISTKFATLGGSGGGTSYSQPSVSSAIGGVEPVSTSGINTPTGENTNICSLSLPAGVWMLCGQVAFPVNATGRRAAKISTTSGDTANVISTVVQDAVSGALTRCSTSRCLSFAAQTTVYLIGYQTSNETLSCSGQFEATRIA